MKVLRKTVCVVLSVVMALGVIAVVGPQTAKADVVQITDQAGLISAIATGGTYELQNDITVGSDYAFPTTGAATTIDLNGHNITTNGYGGRFANTAAYQARKLVLNNSQTTGGVISGFATSSSNVFYIQVGGLYIGKNVTISGCGNTGNSLILCGFGSQYAKIIEIEGTITGCTATDLIRTAIPTSSNTKKASHTINIKPGADLTGNTITGSTVNMQIDSSITGSNVINVTGGKLEKVTAAASTETHTNTVNVSGGYIGVLSAGAGVTTNITGGWFGNNQGPLPGTGYGLMKITVPDDRAYPYKVVPDGSVCSVEYYDENDIYTDFTQTDVSCNYITAAVAPVKTGHTFQEWNSLVDGTGVSVTAGSVMTGYENQVIKLYAIWDSVAVKAVQVTVGGNTSQYDTINEAWAAARAAGAHADIRLNENCAIVGRDETVAALSALTAGNDITLDLNGFTLSGCVSDAKYAKLTDVTGGAVLSIIDSSAAQTGVLTKNSGASTSNGGAMIRVTGTGSTLNISGGLIQSNYTFSQGGTLCAVSGGTINITGGSIAYGGASTTKPCIYVGANSAVNYTLQNDLSETVKVIAGGTVSIVTNGHSITNGIITSDGIVRIDGAVTAGGAVNQSASAAEFNSVGGRVADTVTARFNVAAAPVAGSSFVLKYTDGTGEVTVDGVLNSVTGCYDFDVTLNVNRIADKLTYEIWDGSEKLATLENYSVLEYFDAVFAQSGTTAAQKTFMADLICYADLLQQYAAAKGYAEPGTAFTAPSWVASAQTPVTTAPVAADNVKAIVSSAKDANNWKISTATLNITDKINLKFRITMPSDGTAEVLKDGVPMAADAYSLAGGILKIERLSPTDYSAVYTVSINRGSETMHAVTYSVYSYCFNKQSSADHFDANDTTTPTMADLALAIYRYGKSAEVLA